MVRTLFFLMLTISTVSWASQDPTAPLNWVKPEQTQPTKKRISQPLPKLQSIVCIDALSCKAVINNQVRVAGERVAGYKINKIESERVVLSRGGKQWQLELFSMDIKQ
ncbi:MSHA biogenesis protein MshK [Vibrio sinaloensis DSM 21326]|uniref:MSHA biogenesis protein MshK n=1 Tax=Vibrio sinaloensis DSM 21326 TaxID=945550 RepID=E8M2F9_PHOS4|nr:hypothetical protein [Vibrio sinaloensis]EGA71786.1 MSHA biogenesis protein MshK [Vibrio sinaloensis DSM 21326]